MFTKSKSLLALLLTGGILATSCEKEDLHEITPNEAMNSKIAAVASSANLSSINLLFEETFEGTNPFSTAHNLEIGDWDYALQFVTNPVYSGSKAARFEIREDQPLVKRGKRAEVTIVKGANGDITKDTWYSFKVYFPTNGYEYDSKREVINQWYQNGSPATSLRTHKDRVLLETGNTMSTRKKIDLGPIIKDTWQEYVLHFIHSHGSDGLIEIWHNGTKILTHKGGNMYDDVLPKWKVGLYKSAFKYGTSSVDKRVLYFDNIRVGNEKASFEEMNSMPATTTTPEQEEEAASTTSTQNVVSYTLINSNTEKDILTIKDGAKLSLRELGTNKLAIRANTYPAKVGSVKMVMSGDYSRTRIEDVVPYTLFGDDTNGNYYSWSVTPGTYTVKARPYAGNKKNIGEPTGSEYSVTFTIIN